MNGFFLIDKKEGWTSRDVVTKISHIFHIKKVGHSGTLDPFATGLLLGGHDPFTWKVKNSKPEFLIIKDRTAFSKNHEEAITKWLSHMSNEDKELACKIIFTFFSDSKTVYDLIGNVIHNLAIKRSKMFKERCCKVYN